MKKIPELFSSEPLSVDIPDSWSKLSFRQFKMICNLFSAELFASSFDTILFMRLAGIKFLDYSDDGSVILMYQKNAYVVSRDIGGVALEAVEWVHNIADISQLAAFMPQVHRSAVDLRFNDISYGKFIAADNVYTGYLATQRTDLIDKLVSCLWPRMRKIKPWHRMAAVIWFSSLKQWLVSCYPDLFAAPDPNDLFSSNTVSPAAVKESMNAQIRALTKGDITLEQRVLEAPLHRALTELNQLAKEYKEFNSHK